MYALRFSPLASLLVACGILFVPADAAETKKPLECACDEKPETPDRVIVCPVWCYMNHGSYCSYYGVVSPTCQQARGFDAICGLKTGCPNSPDCVSFRQEKEAGSKKIRRTSHYTHPDLAEKGIDPPSQATLSPGAQQVNNGVRVVEFCKQVTSTGPTGTIVCHGKTLVAKVFLVDVTPQGFEKARFGIGYQIDPQGVNIDRTVKNSAVRTTQKAQGKRTAVIEVKVDGTTWQEYNILFLKAEAPD